MGGWERRVSGRVGAWGGGVASTAGQGRVAVHGDALSGFEGVTDPTEPHVTLPSSTGGSCCVQPYGNLHCIAISQRSNAPAPHPQTHTSKTHIPKTRIFLSCPAPPRRWAPPSAA